MIDPKENTYPKQSMILICLRKKEHGIVYQTILQEAGFESLCVTSIYDALKLASQEMPHIILSEAVLEDGNAGIIYDRIKQDPILEKIPVVALLQKKTKEEVGILINRKFAGVFLGKVEPPILIKKINELLNAFTFQSPYFTSPNDVGIDSKIVVTFQANVLGICGDNVVSSSSHEIQPSTSIVCVPSVNKYNPVIFKSAANYKRENMIYNLFPMSRVVGKGREWLNKLPTFNLEPNSQTKAKRKLIFYDPNADRAKEFAKILQGYDIEVDYVKSPVQTLSQLQMSQSLSCIYLHELTQDGKGIDWKNAYQALPADKKAPVIIGTGSLNAKSAGSLIYIQRPFGLGMFLDMIEAAFDSLDANQQNFEKDRTGIQASYQVPAKLLGLDENGGILEIKTPVLEGSQLLIEHSFLKQAWHGNTKVTVVATDKVHGYSDTWHLKFKAVGVGMNKAKYWAAMKQAFYNLAKEQQSLSTRSNNELEKKLA